jgi:hypothetical protein
MTKIRRLVKTKREGIEGFVSFKTSKQVFV